MSPITDCFRKYSGIFVLLLLSGIIGCASAPSPQHNAPGHRPASKYNDRGVLAAATSVLGTPYRYGGETPRGFDCSGLVFYSYSSAGIPVPRTTREQYRQSDLVQLKYLRPGDLVFFTLGRGKVSHVGIYAGNDRFIHAPSSGKRVSYAHLENPYWKKRLVAAGRYH